MKPEKNIKISVIVPAFRQEKNIQRDLESIISTLDQTRWDFEVICVVDGLVDQTMENAKKIHNPKLKVFGYQTNKGKGYAVRYGMARTEGDLIAFIDSGMDIEPNGISMLIEHMIWYQADIVVGSKRHAVSKVKYPFIRKVYSFCYHTLVKVLFNLPIRDTQVGLKVYRRAVLEKVLPRLIVKKFAFDIEILAVAYRLGFRKIYEAPVQIQYDDQNSSFASVKVAFSKHIWQMILDTFSIFYRMHFLKYYDDGSKRKWNYDNELKMRVNTGEVGGE